MSDLIAIKRIVPFHPRGNYVEWSVASPPAQPWTFDIQRSESPTGPFTTVSDSPVVDGLSYFDRIPTHFLHRHYYYRVVLRGDTTGSYQSAPETYQHMSAHLPRHQRGQIRKMRYDLGKLLRVDNGVPVKIFKRRTEGTNCTNCTSSVLNIPVLAICDTCYGTKFVGGFYAPVNTLCKFDAPPVREVFDNEGESETQIHSLHMLDFPLLVVDDLVFEIGTGDLYEVKDVPTTQRRRVVVHQEPVVSKLPRSHHFYTLVNHINTTRFQSETYVFDPKFFRL